MNIEELLEKLKSLYETDILGTKEYVKVISQERYKQVDALIREFANDNHDSELGELKAKVYVYEKIIANSNFSMAVKNKTLDEDRILLEIKSVNENIIEALDELKDEIIEKEAK